MIRIGQPWEEKLDGKVRCCCDVYEDELKHTIWFEADSKYGQYFCYDRADAYLIGLLNFAMRKNHDIICDIPVTEELLYNIRTILIPSLAEYGNKLYSIRVDADTIPAIRKDERGGAERRWNKLFVWNRFPLLNQCA